MKKILFVALLVVVSTTAFSAELGQKDESICTASVQSGRNENTKKQDREEQKENKESKAVQI